MVAPRDIANDALRYAGYGYVWGGRANVPGNWDCSSFVSYVLGHDLHLRLPGGNWNDPGYPPHAHGPRTLQYIDWGGKRNRSQVVGGTLIVWQTHMGIAIDDRRMISARDSIQGTGIDYFDGAIPGETAHYRAVPGLSGTGSVGAKGGALDIGGLDIDTQVREISKQLWYAGRDINNYVAAVERYRGQLG